MMKELTMPGHDASPGYAAVLGADQTNDHTRLTTLAAASDPISRRRFLELNAPAYGWRCLDIGPGPGTLAQWLAERTRVPVTALDINTTTFQYPQSVHMVEGDIVTDEKPEWQDQFDLVHARHVLLHLPQRHHALTAMASWCRPGGMVVVTDASTVTPTNPLIAAALTEIWRGLTDNVGSDPLWARGFPGPLQDLGLEYCGVTIEVMPMRGGDAMATFVRMVLTQTSGHPCDPQLLDLLEDPETLDWTFSLATMWGTKPHRSNKTPSH
jgi:SAM-dependent methyltransferase